MFWRVTAPARSWPCRRTTSAILEFAKKFNLPIVRGCPAAGGDNESIGFVGDGISVNSGFINGLPTTGGQEKNHRVAGRKRISAARPSITNSATGCSAASVIGASRFRLFGKKMPTGNLYHEALPESALPVLPPSLDDYKPTPDGQPPLARAKDWVNLPDGSCAKPTPCRNGPEVAGIICGIWMRE